MRDSEPLPDVCVVAGNVSDFDHRHPSTAELVIEVAVTTAVADREKAAIYAEAGVKEYWIVLPTERQGVGVAPDRDSDARRTRVRIPYASLPTSPPGSKAALG